LHREKTCDKPSTIIKLTNDSQVKIIRKWMWFKNED
jgi:L-threonylcarbamoyladenylate synthase